MSKMRIHELAKSLDKSSTDIISILKEQGIEVKSHMSTITDEQIDMVMEQLNGSKQPKETKNEVLKKENQVKQEQKASFNHDVKAETKKEVKEQKKEVQKKEENKENQKQKDKNFKEQNSFSNQGNNKQKSKNNQKNTNENKKEQGKSMEETKVKEETAVEETIRTIILPEVISVRDFAD